MQVNDSKYQVETKFKTRWLLKHAWCTQGCYMAYLLLLFKKHINIIPWLETIGWN